MYYGIVPVDAIDVTGKTIGHVGYAMFQSGDFFPPSPSNLNYFDALGSFDYRKIGGSAFYTGDTVTVTVDLDASKISFKKNGADNGTPQDIPHGSYLFAWDLRMKGEAVTIIERK